MLKYCDQAPMSDKMKVSPEESPDDDDSQATDSVIGDPDITDCINTEKEEKVSFSTFNPFEVNKYDDSDNEGFVTVQNTRRPFPTKAIPSKITPAVQKQFGERVSCLDGIGASCGKLQLSDQAVNTKPNSETSVEELLQPCARKSPFCSTATIVGKPASHGQLKSETNTAPQLKEIAPPTDATGMRSNTTQSKVPSSLSFDEFPSLEGKTVKRPTHNSMNPSSTTWSNFKAPEVSVPNANGYQSEVLTREPRPQHLLNMSSQRISGQTSSSTGFTSSTRPAQPEMSPTPVALSQSFQTNVTGPSGARKIPEGVFVVCDHFLQDNRGGPAENKTCKLCENRGMLKYAAWNNNRYYWQVMRPYPVYGVPPKVVLDVCRHFSWDRPCPKEPCTFPHGEQETNMWTLERKGRKYINSTRVT
ncbi:hypothetical protein OS493_023649 [Desmophyllum pertusum]|uniref:Uncharacterized protein n=1 Tax=Desmophyllum pertusum TaxID=174260 RepID=A0A9W9ZAX8_9CNID|nr:hypothetical protein OS493_023649 [Desmophyllum pertusum]